MSKTDDADTAEIIQSPVLEEVKRLLVGRIPLDPEGALIVTFSKDVPDTAIHRMMRTLRDALGPSSRLRVLGVTEGMVSFTLPTDSELREIGLRRIGDVV